MPHDLRESADTDVSSGSQTPAGERGPDGPAAAPPSDVPWATDSLHDVLAELTQRPERDPITKQFIRSGLAAAKTLARSEQYWSAVEPLKQALVERIKTDLAVDASSVETLLGLIDGYSEVRLFRKSMFLRLIDSGGPISTRGKTRGLYRAYLDALDREMKLAQILGLERRSKRIDLAKDFAEQERARG